MELFFLIGIGFHRIKADWFFKPFDMQSILIERECVTGSSSHRWIIVAEFFFVLCVIGVFVLLLASAVIRITSFVVSSFVVAIRIASSIFLSAWSRSIL